MDPTAGPYFIRVAANGDCGISAPGTGVFAEMYVDIRRAGEGAKDEALANARLYAASPELLEIAKEYVRVAEYYAARSAAEGDDEGQRLKLATAARTAEVIASAEGRS